MNSVTTVSDEKRERWDAARAHYEAGGTLRECAQLAGCRSHATVHGVAKREDWQRTDGLALERVREREQATRAATEATRSLWAEVRQSEVDEIASEIPLLRQLALDAAVAGSASDAQRLATTYAIFVDKAQLLSGEVTERIATQRDPREHAAQILDEIAEARRAKAVAS